MIRVCRSDITKLGGTPFESQAIVNAANPALHRGGGVCGAIFDAAGIEPLTKSCNLLAPCPPGEIRVTPAFSLEEQGVHSIIHAVGPDCHLVTSEVAEMLLRLVYKNAVSAAMALGLDSIAFPSISTGIYSFPGERAAHISVDTLREFESAPLVINLIAFDAETERLWKNSIDR